MLWVKIATILKLLNMIQEEYMESHHAVMHFDFVR